MTDFFIQWHTNFLDTDRVPVIFAAMLLCMILGMITGPLAGNANPFFWQLIDRAFGSLGERLDKNKRKQADLMFRGFMLCAFVLVLSLMLAKSFSVLALAYNDYRIGEILLFSILISTGSIWYALLRLYFACEQDKVVEGAFYAIARTTRRNLAAGDEFGVTRAAMALSARSFDKALVAPALWYLIGGFPFAVIYAALAALSWRFGKDGFNTGFAAVPMALERLMGFVPSILSAILITMAANFTPTAKIHKAVAAWMGAKGRSNYEQGGLPLSALAWALNISLGGASQDLSGSAIKAEWVGPKGATAKIDHKHLRRGIYINVIAHILFIAVLLSLYVWGGVLG